MSLAEPTNLDEAVKCLQLARQESLDYDRKLAKCLHTNVDLDAHGIQVLNEFRSAWVGYQKAKIIVESFGGQFLYPTNDDVFTTSKIVIADSDGTELLTYYI